MDSDPDPDHDHDHDPAPELYDSLAGQVALVTGATRGIGRRIAADLAGLGATVYAGARDTGDVDVTADDADRTATDGAGEIRPVELDVTDGTDRRAAVDRVEEVAGRLDVLVNNAGVMDTRERLHEMPVEAVERTLSVNLRGATLLTRVALPVLLDGSGARVVNLTSSMGSLSDMGTGAAAYRVSKVGLNGLTAYLDAEYGDDGLLANAATPGWVRTDMGGESAPRSVAEGADTPVWLCRFRPGAPAGRVWKDRTRVDW